MPSGPCSISCSRTASIALSCLLSIRSLHGCVAIPWNAEDGQLVPGHAPAPAYRLRPDRLFRPCVTQPASIDIAIEDSSETGCLIYAPSALPVGTQIAVGIPGLRRWRA